MSQFDLLMSIQTAQNNAQLKRSEREAWETLVKTSCMTGADPEEYRTNAISAYREELDSVILCAQEARKHNRAAQQEEMN